MDDRFQSRRDRLRSGWDAAEIDALLVSSETNVRYLAGFTGDSSVLLLARDRDLIVSDGRFTTQLEQECPGLEARIRSPGEEMNAAVASVLESWGLKHVGFEAAHCSVADQQALADAAATVVFVGLSGQVEALRQIKDETEIAAIREAVRFAERAFSMLRAGLRVGETEKDVADALEGYLRRCGATAASFPPIVAVGVSSALPHARPTADGADRPGRFRADRLGSDRPTL